MDYTKALTRMGFEVNRAISIGWKPQDGISSSTHNWYIVLFQAMFIENPNAEFTVTEAIQA